MKTFKVLFVFMFAVLIATPALAFQGFNGNQEIGLFNKVKCGAGMTCSRTDKDKFTITCTPEVESGDFSIIGEDGANAVLTFAADEGDDNGDVWELRSEASGNAFAFYNDVSGTMAQKLSLSTAGAVAFPGSLAINTSMFTVDGATGDTDVAGDATITGDLTVGGTITGATVSDIVAATATTATAGQCGSTFVSSGAVEMELPDANTVLGCTYTFVAGDASAFTIDPDDADVIVYDDASAGDALKSSGTIGETITIRAGSGSQWFVIGVNGTWAADN